LFSAGVGPDSRQAAIVNGTGWLAIGQRDQVDGWRKFAAGRNLAAAARLSDGIVDPSIERIAAMKTRALLVAVAALTLAAGSADAKGCLKGAVVGGVAGHYAGHHGVLGAAAGCLYGRHRAKEQDRQQTERGAPAGQEKL
jgi:hypothetical protein